MTCNDGHKLKRKLKRQDIIPSEMTTLPYKLSTRLLLPLVALCLVDPYIFMIGQGFGYALS